MIKSMMQSSGGFSERRDNKITFPEISGKILEKVRAFLLQVAVHGLEGSRARSSKYRAGARVGAPDGVQLPRLLIDADDVIYLACIW